MTNKLANYLMLLFILLLGLGYLYYTYVIATARPMTDYGPIEFPVAIGVVLVILCVFEIAREVLRGPAAGADLASDGAGDDGEDGVYLRIPNGGKVLGTVLLMAAYFFFWGLFDQFYPATAVFFTSLVVMYRGSLDPRFVATAAAIAVIFTLVLYLVFQLSFGIRLG